jgi:hypothetical protein
MSTNVVRRAHLVPVLRETEYQLISRTLSELHRLPVINDNVTIVTLLKLISLPIDAKKQLLQTIKTNTTKG